MVFRKATEEDLPIIVSMLAEEYSGKQRETYKGKLFESYKAAFKNILTDANQELIVVECETKEILGTFQLSFIQYLTYSGGIRAQIGDFRIKKDQKGSGLGCLMLAWAIERAKERNAYVLQLNTDSQQSKTATFYQCLGFKPTNESMKLHLE